MIPKDYWNQIYQNKTPEGVSWFQKRPETSLALIGSSGMSKDGGILDVGGGASTLADCLLDAGYGKLAVLDISAEALNRARTRLGARAGEVDWYEADVTNFEPPHRFGFWHDRAVFHFLTTSEARVQYVATLRRTLLPGGHVIIATFALDGPAKCSGLDVMRHDERSIGAELGNEFVLCETLHETHLTPWGSEQRFVFCLFRQVRSSNHSAGVANEMTCDIVADTPRSEYSILSRMSEMRDSCRCQARFPRRDVSERVR